MKKDDLTIYAMQTDIAWEDKERNLQKLESRLRSFHDFNADIPDLQQRHLWPSRMTESLSAG